MRSASEKLSKRLSASKPNRKAIAASRGLIEESQKLLTFRVKSTNPRNARNVRTVE
jgi:hypothetical protein